MTIISTTYILVHTHLQILWKATVTASATKTTAKLIVRFANVHILQPRRCKFIFELTRAKGPSNAVFVARLSRPEATSR